MKKLLSSMATLALVALGLSIAPLGGNAQAAPDAPVTFNDPVVESAVRYRLKLEDTEVITESKLAELRSLDFWTPEEGTREITDLTGLEKAVNLSEVVVESAKWSLLKDLPPSVTSIWLMSVKGKPDFAGFPDHLVNLTELTIKDTDITSFKQLPSRYFDQITTLDLEVVEIPNLCDPSSEFTKFNSLENLTATPVLQFGEGRTYASEVESLFGYPSPDISCLSKYDLKSLDISYNKIADVTLLSSMQNLSELNIKGNTISDLSPLKSLSALNECSAYSQGRLLNELDFKRTVSERTFSLDPVIDRNGQPVPFDVNPYGFYEEERPVIPGLSRLIQNEDGTFTFADDSSNKAVIEFSNSDDPGEVPEGDCWFTGTILIEHVEDAAPGEDPVTPGEDPVAPGDEPTTPGDEPTTPGEDPVAPGDEPTTPGEDPVAPGDEPTTPGEDPVAPGDEPTTPGEDPVAPGDEPVAPGDEPTTPGDDPVAPGDEPTTPGDDPVAPGDEPTTPGEDPVAPGDEPTTPGDEPVAPGDDTVTPSEDPTTPGDDTVTPGDNATTTPGDDATTPTDDATTPGGTDSSDTGNTNSGTPTPSASASTSSQLPRTGTDALPLVFATMILLAAGGTLITIRRHI